MNPEEEIITLEAFFDPILAHIIKGRLEASGIPCFLADDVMIGVNPFYNAALGGVKLKIFARDKERCLNILNEDPELQ